MTRRYPVKGPTLQQAVLFAGMGVVCLGAGYVVPLPIPVYVMSGIGALSLALSAFFFYGMRRSFEVVLDDKQLVLATTMRAPIVIPRALITRVQIVEAETSTIPLGRLEIAWNEVGKTRTAMLARATLSPEDFDALYDALTSSGSP